MFTTICQEESQLVAFPLPQDYNPSILDVEAGGLL